MPGRGPDARPDLVDRQFRAQAPDQLWVADITYCRIFAGWVYAAFVVDVFIRRVVGWQLSTPLRTDLALDALNMGLWARAQEGHDTSALMHHSDRGSSSAAGWCSGRRAADLNEHGQVVGYSWVPGGAARRAFRWEPRTERMTDLGLGAPAQVPCTLTMAAAIDARGDVAGTRVDDDGRNYCSGVLWSARGPRSSDVPLELADLNDRGLVDGSQYETRATPGGEIPGLHAVAWSACSGRSIDLGRGAAVAGNEHGQTVGWAPTAEFTTRAVIWTLDRR